MPSTFTVTSMLDVVDPADGKLSLREAITRTNSLAGADVIVVPAGVYKTALLGSGDDANISGDFDITDTVTIQGAGAGLTIIDGQRFDRVFDVSGTPNSIKVVLQGLTVRNGSVAGPGGGIRAGDADLVVRDCIVAGNRASETGGGISNVAAPATGDVRIVRTILARNVAGTSGGGIFVGGNDPLTVTLTVTDSTVRRNVAGDNGGGVLAITATLTGCTISGNRTESAGGGLFINTVMTLSGSTVSGNFAKTQGGGILAATATLTNSTVSGNTASIMGGGMDAATATLTGSNISGNKSGTEGGGIRVTDTATLANCIVSGNFAGTQGGGVRVDTATLTNCTISGNKTGTEGAGLYASSATTLSKCTVSGNISSGLAGGIRAATATLTNCTVSGNWAGSSGGGIFGVAEARLTNTTVSGNWAGNIGGGILADTATLTNSTISGNTAVNDGGGVNATTATLLNCTVVENIAHTGGGLFHSAGGTFSVRNTIVALNLVDFTGAGPDVFGDFNSQGHNLIGGSTGGTGFANGINGDLVGTVANPIDPKLGPLQNNGGRTQTHALKAGSLAIDTGDNAGVPATDQRGFGFARKKDGNGDGIAVVDIGAFER